MAKKEVKNELVENAAEVVAVPTQAPTQEVALNEVPVQSETPGHTTRAFRG
jgi:hypothetical protein